MCISVGVLYYGTGTFTDLTSDWYENGTGMRQRTKSVVNERLSNFDRHTVPKQTDEEKGKQMLVVGPGWGVPSGVQSPAVPPALGREGGGGGHCRVRTHKSKGPTKWPLSQGPHHLYSVPSRVWTVPSLSAWKFWKIRDDFDPDGQLMGWGLRRDRIQLPVGVEIISNFSKFSCRQGRNCPHSRWDIVYTHLLFHGPMFFGCNQVQGNFTPPSLLLILRLFLRWCQHRGVVGFDRHRNGVFRVPSRVWTVPSLCSWKFWKI